MWWFLLGLVVGELAMVLIIGLFSANKESEENENDDRK
jgi:hypothetical protein